MIDKSQLVAEVLRYLSIELHKAEMAAEQAKAAATDDESIAETQYDTLAIEAAYLAEGQSKRVAEFKHAIDRLKSLPLKTHDNERPTSLGCCVQLSEDQGEKQWYFISPSAGGFRAQVGTEQVTVVTQESPMGQSLLGKYLDDEVALKVGPLTMTDHIVAIV